jgi:hypothetical protein
MAGSGNSSSPDKQSASDEGPPAILGHQLLRAIARGSYGEIWLARTALGTFRAVKIIRRAVFKDARPYDREFAGIQRYEPISREHEGLVDVLKVGREDAAGFFYYVMELADDAGNPNSELRTPKDQCVAAPPADNRKSAIENQKSYIPLTLAYLIRQRHRLPVSEVIEIGIKLAQALDFLHSKRLVHRDIKPANIIFVAGQPKFADVGLVGNLGGPQSFVGTEGYIPPEGPGTAQADIYSLGKVLYEAATGKDRQDFPDLPTRLGEGQDDPALPELNEVLLKACESNPRARYSTAAQMTADLQRLKAGQSLRARRARRRRRRSIGTIAAVLLGAGVLVGLVRVIKGGDVLLVGKFDGPELDRNVWADGQKEWHGFTNSGLRKFRLGQTNGELILEARAQHQGGYTTSAAAWADARVDLKQMDSCLLEIESAASNLWGSVAVSISDGSAPADPDDSKAVRLMKNSGSWARYLTRVEILRRAQAAVVYRGALSENEFEIVGLSELKSWYLRLYACASSSRDHDKAFACFRIRKASAVREASPKTVIGHVVNGLTGRPVAGAIIRDATGRNLAKSLANGAFKLSAGKKPMSVRAELPGFDPSAQFLVEGGATERDPIEMALHKRSFGFGDVTNVIRYTNFEASSLGFWGTNICVLGRGDDGNYVLRPVDLSGGELLPEKFRLGPGPDQQGLGSLVQCGNRLLVASPYPNSILYDVTGGVLQPFLEPKYRIVDSPLNNLPLLWIWTAAFDGDRLWLLVKDITRSQVGLYALDPEGRKPDRWMPSADREIAGVAWDTEQKHFWMSTSYSREGWVYAVDREKMLAGGRVEAGRGREFRGNYNFLTFGEGYLWGLDVAKKQICKIKVTD